MARIRLDRLTPIVTLIVFLIIWWITPSFIKRFTQASFEEIQAPIWVASDQLETLADRAINNTKSKQELIDTIKELKRQNAYYKQIKNINENDLYDNLLKYCEEYKDKIDTAKATKILSLIHI